MRSFSSLLSAARGPKSETPADAPGQAGDSDLPLPDRMANGFERFKGRVLFILSGDDYTAQEFKDLIAQIGALEGAHAASAVSSGAI